MRNLSDMPFWDSVLEQLRKHLLLDLVLTWLLLRVKEVFDFHDRELEFHVTPSGYHVFRGSSLYFFFQKKKLQKCEKCCSEMCNLKKLQNSWVLHPSSVRNFWSTYTELLLTFCVNLKWWEWVWLGYPSSEVCCIKKNENRTWPINSNRYIDVIMFISTWNIFVD